MADEITAIHARILHALDDPDRSADDAVEYHDNGVLLLQAGRILACGDRQSISVPEDADVLNYHDRLLIPGLVDTRRCLIISTGSLQEKTK